MQMKEDEEIKPAAYLRAAKAHQRSGKQKDAFRLLQQAAVRFPEEPVILSYYGCLQALVDKKYRSGVEVCKKAIGLFKEKASSGQGAVYPFLYLNLGRAYIAAGRKQDAISAFNQGLKYDNSHYELLKELRGLGVRKNPSVPFLGRSNPINKYIGMVVHKTTESEEKGSRRKTASR